VTREGTSGAERSERRGVAETVHFITLRLESRTRKNEKRKRARRISSLVSRRVGFQRRRRARRGMASVLRSRGAARVGVGAGGGDRSVVLDDEAQEAIVSDLERAAIRSSRTWRAVFGATSVLAGAWFARSGVRAATARDATEAYVGVRAAPDPARDGAMRVARPTSR